MAARWVGHNSGIGVARNLSWGHSAGFITFFLGDRIEAPMGVGCGKGARGVPLSTGGGIWGGGSAPP